MFRSGKLTRARLHQILGWVEKLPHNLKAVAKACNIYPADLMAWYVAGQDPDCRDPLMAELAWRVAEVRAARAAANYARIEAAANGGTKQKTVTKPDGDEEITVEDVLPAAWAIERLEKMAAESVWEISPNAEQAAELHAMMRELEPTPLLPSGEAVGGDPEPAPGPHALEAEVVVTDDGIAAPGASGAAVAGVLVGGDALVGVGPLAGGDGGG